MNRLAILFSSCALATLAAAQQPSFTRYGTGCDLPGQPPALLNSSDLPRIGAPFRVTLQGPNSITPVSQDQPYLMIGFASLAVPVPLISSLQPAGCTLLVDPAVVIPMPSIGTAYSVPYTLNIPFDSNLLGMHCFMQWAIRYTRFSTGATMVRFSNGGECVVGI